MKFAIVGSRGYRDLYMVRAFVRSLDPGSIVVSGGAPGVDSVAEYEARKRRLAVQIFPANWDRYGKRAGFLRNRLIVDAADEVHAFWDGKSNGTKSTIQLANAAGKPVHIHR